MSKFRGYFEHICVLDRIIKVFNVGLAVAIKELLDVYLNDSNRFVVSLLKSRTADKGKLTSVLVYNCLSGSR